MIAHLSKPGKVVRAMNDNTPPPMKSATALPMCLPAKRLLTEITDVITLAELERDRLQAEREEARAVAFNPLTKSADVEAARRAGLNGGVGTRTPHRRLGSAAREARSRRRPC